MDRISDSGSDDLGSSPDGITFFIDYQIIANMYVQFIRTQFEFIEKKSGSNWPPLAKNRFVPTNSMPHLPCMIYNQQSNY